MDTLLLEVDADVGRLAEEVEGLSNWILGQEPRAWAELVILGAGAVAVLGFSLWRWLRLFWAGQQRSTDEVLVELGEDAPRPDLLDLPVPGSQAVVRLPTLYEMVEEEAREEAALAAEERIVEVSLFTMDDLK